MASLARSLLALALVALLQAVSAEPRGEFPGFSRSDHFVKVLAHPQCTKVLFGRRPRGPGMSYTLPLVYVTEANSDVKIDDPREGMRGIRLIGEEVTVCNRRGRSIPRVTQAFPDSFDVVRVMLGFCVPPPIDMTMEVTRFIDVVVPPNNSETAEFLL